MLVDVAKIIAALTAITANAQTNAAIPVNTVAATLAKVVITAATATIRRVVEEVIDSTVPSAARVARHHFTKCR